MPNQNTGKLVWGIGTKDANEFINGKNGDSYSTWKNMLRRCVDEKIYETRHLYAECTVCEEWKSYGTFKTWFDEHAREGASDIEKSLVTNTIRQRLVFSFLTDLIIYSTEELSLATRISLI